MNYFPTPSHAEIVSLASKCGFELMAMSDAQRRLAMLPEGTMVAAQVRDVDIVALVLRAINIGREQGVLAFEAPIEWTDDEIDTVLGRALGYWGRQQRWLELVGRPAARTILAAVSGSEPFVVRESDAPA